jgi:ASC-1-like (ASCH) protein
MNFTRLMSNIEKRIRVFQMRTITIDDGIAIYRQFYSEEKEREYGVLAIKIKIIPYLK